MTEFFPPVRSIADILQRLDQRVEARRHNLPETDLRNLNGAAGAELDDEAPLERSRGFRESVVMTTERIARSIALRSGHAGGFNVPFHRLTDARSKKIWKQACTAMRLMLDVDVDDFVFRLQIDDAAARREGARQLSRALSASLCGEPTMPEPAASEDA